MFLLNLPEYLIKWFLSKWLSPYSISQLDISLCNRIYRNKFLEVISKTTFETSQGTTLYFEWIIKRNIYCKELHLYQWNQNVVDYLIEYSKIHFVSLVIHSDNSSFSDFLRSDWNSLINSELKEISFREDLGKNQVNLNNDILEKIANVCSHLKVFSLKVGDFPHGWIQLSEGLIFIAKKCVHLEDVAVEYINCVSDLFLTQITNNCKNLKTISIRGCRNVTFQSVRYVIFNCSNLVLFDFRSCRHINHSKYVNLSEMFDIKKIKKKIITDEALFEETSELQKY